MLDSAKSIVTAIATAVNLVNNNFFSSSVTKEVTEAVLSHATNITNISEELIALSK